MSAHDDDQTKTAMGFIESLLQKKNKKKVSFEETQTNLQAPDETRRISLLNHDNTTQSDQIKKFGLRAVVLLATLFLVADYFGGKKESAQTSKIQATADNPESAVLYGSGGKGMVYNCLDESWSCVGKKSYINCQNKSKLPKKECISQGVFNSSEDCLEAQKRYVQAKVSPPNCQ
jgi:hypothetical protein